MAYSGHDVICADVDEDKIDRLKRGEIPIYEPGLELLVEENMEQGRLRFSTDLAGAVDSADVIFIAVGTPPGEDGSADLQHVLAVAETIGRSMNGDKIVITKSTVPVGTANRVREAIESLTNHGVHVCSNPEFLKKGSAVEDFLKPDRVVLGVDSDEAARVLRDLYAPFVRTGNDILLMDIASAELTKYAANAMLAARISFMNSIAQLCEVADADVDMVRRGIGSDERIGQSFLFPGVGYGGSCFPKDLKALIRTSRDLGVEPSILQAVEETNEMQKGLILRRVIERFGSELAGHTFALWGLAFKPNTDDMREAPSLVTIEGLLGRGARVVAHDPAAMEEAQRVLGNRIELRGGNYDALEGASALLIHTEWHPYRRPNFGRMLSSLTHNVVIDGRNLYSPERMGELGFEYYSVGRRPVQPTRPVEPA